MPSWKEEYKAFHAGGGTFISDNVADNYASTVYTSSFNVSEKSLRISRHQREEAKQPASFTSNTMKEELCLKYVDTFLDNFRKRFPHRKPLFITPPNEMGVKKFVCTTLKATELPFKSTYNYDECAKFVASFLEYEPLERVTEPPSVLPSPSCVINWYRGDSFDYATLLASFLLGVGYDAYVCYGYAPKWVTLCDQSETVYGDDESLLEAELGAKEDDSESKSGEGSSSPNASKDRKYKVESKVIRNSQYLLEMERRAREEGERKRRLEEEDSEEEIPKAVQEDTSLLHSWVIVLAGKRELTEHVFIEVGLLWERSTCSLLVAFCG
jgi:hypothetical protein